ncbi:MAG TPA: hypothetical protein IGS52_03975 [Oscillatoriaceae cyanobacterium M33_DOE_052]|uniref:ATP-grasp domain-containing protein n=1 Tax=Planktothricoides sp. SpSt-374 TaxID=2282167 RepID=A0A7C3VE97_9CYAN|nr:hypothetical protein [Oscillatoriaceae cyanobacterium M33_DOE_052]
MNAIILGNAQDAHAAHIHQALTAAGIPVDYLDTRLFPTQLAMSWEPETGVGSLTLPGGKRLTLKDIKSAFWRSLGDVYVPELQNADSKRIAIMDAISTVRCLVQICPNRWINSWPAYQFHKEKPLQLAKAKQLGALIPATLISNDITKVTSFARYLKKAIFKPVHGGAHTQFVNEEHLAPERLKKVLSIAPVTIQEYIPGTNIRTYVIGDAVYSAEIRSPALDFREDLQAEIIPLEISTSVRALALAITRAFMMEWTAIDWRLNDNREYVFLEANFSPMFIHFERQTGFPITDKIVNLLMNKQFKN